MSDAYFEEEEFETQFNGQTVLRILAQARPHWPRLVGFLVAISLASLVDSYFTYLSKLIIDEGIVAENQARLVQLLVRYGGIMVVQAGLVFTFIYLAGVLGERIRYDLRRQMFNHLQTLSFSYFDRTPVGWIMSRVTSDTERIAELVTWGLLDVTWGVMSITTAAIFMLAINWRMALVALLCVPILVIVAAEFKRKILREYRLVRKVNSKITGAFNENITGVRVTKSLAREEGDLLEFQTLTDDMYQASFRAAWLSALFLPVVQLITAAGVGAVVWYGGRLALVGSMTVGDIQAFISYITFMLWPVQEMARVYAQMQQSIASAERAFSLLDALPDVQDKPTAIDPGSVAGDILFEKVGFQYEAGKPVLADFDLRIRQGETIALVGPTGGGKSTIVNLLARFYEPTAGRILIGEHDYTDLTQQAIQSRIGMVLQTPHLFAGTIRENIRYGRLNATDEEIMAAARLAGAHDFITTLEKGYDENVGEGGNLLSVGQKQLISLARAILAEPQIFIMDEATSSVDTLTEALIQRGMDVMMQGRTSLIIAHRLSTIRRADRILVIEAGRIKEMGTHAELIRARGHYYRLYTRQFREERATVYQRLGVAPTG
ncbi:MAG: ABC transporter ATP-binding protein [Anaerolineales bacterium]|nr:ABC transporter ATP-binding protein [Anaerolineales bacterium]MCB8950842.1 ABC transporter ATP-binding protein [Ardenticatenales bacterium]